MIVFFFFFTGGLELGLDDIVVIQLKFSYYGALVTSCNIYFLASKCGLFCLYRCIGPNCI
jgi:hypothetical protein